MIFLRNLSLRKKRNFFNLRVILFIEDCVGKNKKGKKEKKVFWNKMKSKT